jgi:membrane protease subunit (stomatin/prohibitin family)
MGLIKAGIAAISTTLADQWLELITVDSLSTDVLIQKGHARSNPAVNTGRDVSNTKGSRDVITRGSKLMVADGQALLVVENGRVVDFTVEPGEYRFDTSSEPSLFAGNIGQGLIDSFKNLGARIAMGGDTANVQYAYYVNLKEIIGNKFGSSQPMPYRDNYYNSTLYIRYFGTYSLKIVDPLRFYASVAGNVQERYTYKELEDQVESEFYTALDTALGQLSAQGVMFSQIQIKQMELAEIMNTVLDDAWRDLRGLEIVRVGIEKITPDDKSRERIEAFDNSVMLGANDAAAKGRMLDAQAQMFENMGKQQGGVSSNDVAGVGIGMLGLSMGAQQMQNMQAQAMQPGAQMPGFGVAPGQQMPGQPMQGQGMPNPQVAVGVSMAGAGAQSGGASADNLASSPVDASSGSAAAESQPAQPVQAGDAPQPTETWTCECGTANEGNFCSNCGKQKPLAGPWTCECGTVNEGNFCSNCGKPKA